MEVNTTVTTLVLEILEKKKFLGDYRISVVPVIYNNELKIFKGDEA